jgi:4-carboxymuconolactone decarboxylase
MASPTPPAPRLDPLPPDQWDERLTRLLAASGGGTEEPMHIFATLARNADLFWRWIGFGGALLVSGTLPPRLRELVILRTAYRFDGRYEWAQHIELAEREGVNPGELVALGGDLDPDLGGSPVEWSPLERAALAAVDETADDGAVSDATWSALARELDESKLIELLMLIGHYMMLTTVLRSLRVPLEPRAEALAASVAAGPPA